MTKFQSNVNNSLILDFQPNILDSYDQVAYNITFFMLPEENIRTKKYFDRNSRVIIAQTGTDSNFYIEDLDIVNTIAPTATHRTTLSSLYKFTIAEPAGVSLIDKIYRAASAIGISNYVQVPYFLEVKFKGRNPNSSRPVSDNDADLGQLTWIYPITISKIETTVTSAGSTYEVVAAPFDNIANANQIGAAPSNISFSARTFGEAINKLKERLNAREENKLLAEHSLKDVYDFDVSPDFANMSLTDEANLQSQTDRTASSGENVDLTLRTINIEGNIPIPRIIDELLASCVDYQTKSKNSASAETNKKSDEPVMKSIHRVVTETTLMAYDDARQDYQRKFKFTILPYLVGTAALDPAELREDGKHKFNQYRQAKLLVKKYDYIFTGQNTQVINFDAKFAFSWHIPMPKYGGLKTSSDQLSGVFSPVISNKANEAEINKITQNSKKASLKPTSPNKIKSISDIQIDIDSNSNPEGIGRNIPVSWISANSYNKNNNIEGPNSQGREYVNILFDQAFVNEAIPNLAKIELEIKGDPYWLGEPYMSPTASSTFKSISTSIASNKPISEYVKYNYSQVFFLLNMGIPSEYNVNTGFINNISKSLYSGVYLAVSVTNRFSKGQFTQILNSLKHPLIDSKETDE
jgi:hypothetical protein